MAIRYNPKSIRNLNLILIALFIFAEVIFHAYFLYAIGTIIVINLIYFLFSICSNKHIKFLNESIKCEVKPSSIHGVGVFAIRDIKSGEILNVHKCDVNSIYIFKMSDLEKLNKKVLNIIRVRYGVNIYGKRLRFKNPNCIDTVVFMNHSNDANSDSIKAIRDIKEGEEITSNYNVMLKNRPIPEDMKDYYNFLNGDDIK